MFALGLIAENVICFSDPRKQLLKGAFHVPHIAVKMPVGMVQLRKLQVRRLRFLRGEVFVETEHLTVVLTIEFLKRLQNYLLHRRRCRGPGLLRFPFLNGHRLFYRLAREGPLFFALDLPDLHHSQREEDVDNLERVKVARLRKGADLLDAALAVDKRQDGLLVLREVGALKERRGICGRPEHGFSGWERIMNALPVKPAHALEDKVSGAHLQRDDVVERRRPFLEPVKPVTPREQAENDMRDL